MIKKTAFILLSLFVGFAKASAQGFDTVESDRLTDGVASENVVVAERFWKNWFS